MFNFRSHILYFLTEAIFTAWENSALYGRERETERERERQRQTDRDRERDRHKDIYRQIEMKEERWKLPKLLPKVIAILAN